MSQEITEDMAVAAMELVRQSYQVAMRTYGLDTGTITLIDFLALEVENAMAAKLRELAKQV